MTLLTDVTTLVYAGWVVLQTFAAGLLLYLVYGQSRELLYAGAIKTLAASLLLGIVGTVLETLYWAGILADDRFHLLAWLVIFVAGITFTAAAWMLTRDVLFTETRNAPFEEFPVGDATGRDGPTGNATGWDGPSADASQRDGPPGNATERDGPTADQPDRWETVDGDGGGEDAGN